MKLIFFLSFILNLKKCEHKYISTIKEILLSTSGIFTELKTIPFTNNYTIFELSNAKLFAPPISLLNIENVNNNSFKISNIIFTIILDIKISFKNYNLTYLTFPQSIYEIKYDNLDFLYEENYRIKLNENNNNFSLINTFNNITTLGSLTYFNDFTNNKTIIDHLKRYFDFALKEKIITTQNNINLFTIDAKRIFTLTVNKNYFINKKYNDSIYLSSYLLRKIYFENDKTVLAEDEENIKLKEIYFEFEINIKKNNKEETLYSNVIIGDNESQMSVLAKKGFTLSNFYKFTNEFNETQIFEEIRNNYSKLLDSKIIEYYINTD